MQIYRYSKSHTLNSYILKKRNARYNFNNTCTIFSNNLHQRNFHQYVMHWLINNKCICFTFLLMFTVGKIWTNPSCTLPERILEHEGKVFQKGSTWSQKGQNKRKKWGKMGKTYRKKGKFLIFFLFLKANNHLVRLLHLKKV